MVKGGWEYVRTVYFSAEKGSLDRNAQTPGSTCIKQQNAWQIRPIKKCPSAEFLLNVPRFFWKDSPNHGAHWQSHRTRGRGKLSTASGFVHGMRNGSRWGLEVSLYQQDQLQGAQKWQAVIFGSKAWLLDEIGKLGSVSICGILSAWFLGYF